jgi:[ribosomal protein S5]-alanine N-acetyltransferase
MRVRLEHPTPRREAEFLRCVRRSRDLHRGFVTPPSTPAAYREYLRILRRRDQEAFLVVLVDSGELAGVVTIDDIARGSFQYACIGYYSFAPHSGHGLMREGVQLAIRHCFRELKLHRLEANVQPVNRRSITLVASLGFRKEGLALRFVKVAGRWRDHERWALLAEEWRAAAPARRSVSAVTR